MNWLAIVVVGGAAAWFEYNYRRSRRQSKKSADATHPVPETAQVAHPGEEPSIAPGDENDKKLNVTA
ncbi:MAG TPA: hypothetical protein VH518_13670 [Tepidisphaeraceae bacterium]|jgi:hypothetical protein